MKRRRKYRYVLTEDLVFHTRLILGDFSNKWLTIISDIAQEGSQITVKAGYAWDGCSPAWPVLDLSWIGTPDGVIDYRTGKPITHDASCVHDVLTQFKAISRKTADRIFLTMLKQVDFSLAGLYYFGVRVISVLIWKK